MTTARFSFAGAGGQTLDGRLEQPDGAAVGTALFAHCFTCTKQSSAATRVARSLGQHGWRVLRFDFTGLGDSEGDFANAGFVSNIEDVVAAAAALEAAGHPPRLLIGHSLGGAAVIAAAGALESVRAVATINAPFAVEHSLDRLHGDLAAIRAAGSGPVSIGGRAFTVSSAFLDQALGHPQAERLRDLGRALMVLHSPTDAVVAIDNARQIFEAARHPKSFVALDGADHLLTADGAADYAADIIAAWAQKYAGTAA